MWSNSMSLGVGAVARMTAASSGDIAINTEKAWRRRSIFQPMTLRLVLLIGTPASGKSTLARSLESQLRLRDGHNVTRITFDEYEGEFGCLRDKHKAIYLHVLSLDGIVIADDTFHLRSMRKAYWNLCRTRPDTCIAFVLCHIPLEESLKRDALRPSWQQVRPTSIKKIYNSLEDLSQEQRRFSVSSEANDLVGCITERLDQSCLYFEKMQRAEFECHQSLITESTVHNFNLLLNQRVGILISSLPKDEHFALCRDLIQSQKRSLFQRFKRDSSQVPEDLLATLVLPISYVSSLS